MAKVIETSGFCWFCKKRDEDPSSTYNKTCTFEKKSFIGWDGMNKHVKVTTYTRSWDIPRCSTCKRIHNISTIFAVFGCIYPFILIMFAMIAEEVMEISIVGFWADISMYSFLLSPFAIAIWIFLPFICGTKPKYTSRFIPEIFQFIKKGD